MNKEVIIDGVDVSKCDAYKDEHCKYHTSIMFTEDNLCSNFPNCHYKQLKRIESEKQELGKIIDCKNGTIASLAKIRDELKQENAKLKKTLKEIREMAIYDCERECSNNSENCTIRSCLEKRIQRKINKMLGAKDE